MKLHRFYVNKVKLEHDFWLHDPGVLHQWRKVLRFSAGQELVLFDGIAHDRLYKLLEITEREAHLELVTEMKRQLPSRDIYLAWSLLKKDKNDWVLQKCTELGVSHFVPLLAERSEKTGFNLERAEKIIIEAAEQCGRSDIPSVRQPITTVTAFKELKDKTTLFVCEQTAEDGIKNPESSIESAAGVLIGPEGGWSDTEKQLFKDENIQHLNLHDFTLRAETAAVAAVAKLLQ